MPLSSPGRSALALPRGGASFPTDRTHERTTRRQEPLMTFTIRLDPSWFAHPAALARILDQIQALEAPAPYAPPVVRQPGDDGEDLRQLLDGIDTPEPAPAAPAPAPAPATTPAAREWDGVPRTGKGLYKWATTRKALPAVNRIGRQFNY